MHRFFHPSGKFKLDYQVRKDVDVLFDAGSFQLRVRPTKTGLFDIPLSVSSDHGTTSGVLTLVATPGASTHRFTFKSAAAVTKVYIGGVFNGWNNNKTPLTDPDKNGEYTVDLSLEPGRYAYKFFVDGKWVLDPTNTQTEDNGLGDKNSVVTIDSQKRTAAPTIYAEQLTSGKLKVRVVTSGSPIDRVSAVFEGAAGSSSKPAKIEGNEIAVSLPEKRNGFIRVIAANSEGAPSNVVRCPVGSEHGFRWQDAVLYYAFTDRFADGDSSNDRTRPCAL